VIQKTSDPRPGCATERREGRLRLAAVERQRASEFECSARVTLEAPDGAVHEGEASLPLNDQNYLRVASLATLAALERVVGAAGELRLVGLRSLRVFDTAVVAVQVALRSQGHERLLLGIAVAGEDSAVGAVRAVLHATNRLVGNVISR
jgi:hypothetical protein